MVQKVIEKGPKSKDVILKKVVNLLYRRAEGKAELKKWKEVFNSIVNASRLIEATLHLKLMPFF